MWPEPRMHTTFLSEVPSTTTELKFWELSQCLFTMRSIMALEEGARRSHLSGGYATSNMVNYLASHEQRTSELDRKKTFFAVRRKITIFWKYLSRPHCSHLLRLSGDLLFICASFAHRVSEWYCEGEQDQFCTLCGSCTCQILVTFSLAGGITLLRRWLCGNYWKLAGTGSADFHFTWNSQLFAPARMASYDEQYHQQRQRRKLQKGDMFSASMVAAFSASLSIAFFSA